jgi:hypothetical protein
MATRAELERNPYPFVGRLLDSLPSDVRAVTDEDVRKVQEEARALVRAQALARGRSLALSAGRLSDIARYNRVEGLALGSGIVQRLGGGFSLGLSGRYGFSDEQLKGRGALEFRTGGGSSITLAAERVYRDASEEAETSLLRNTIAAQEFGSDYTDPYDVRRVGVSGTLARTGWRPSLAYGVERHDPLTVNASPANGKFEPTIPAAVLRERRLTLALDRPTSLTFGGFEMGSRLAVSGISRVSRVASERGEILRPSLMLDLQRPFGTQRLVLHTIAAGVVSGDSVAPQHYVFLGGPTTAPGYEFHEFVGRGGVSQRVEWRAPVPFFTIPLGRYGRAPGTITLAPFATAVWVDRSPAFREARQGWYPAVGMGALTLFEALRFDVARGLRDGRWTFSVDVGRDFWSVL